MNCKVISICEGAWRSFENRLEAFRRDELPPEAFVFFSGMCWGAGDAWKSFEADSPPRCAARYLLQSWPTGSSTEFVRRRNA